MPRICGRIVALVSACALGGLLAGPAAAGSGGSHDVPLLGTPPTIDGAVGTLEWGGADSFPVTFGTMTGTAYVGRTSTDLYVALTVQDPGGPADSDIFFDNNDNGMIDQGEDLLVINHGQTQDSDWFGGGGNFASQPDRSAGGTNDGATADSFSSANGVMSFEYRHPLCSTDATHDFCFIAPGANQAPSRLGFTIGYRTPSLTGPSFLYPAGILDPAHYAEFVIQPPAGPPAPRLSITHATNAYFASANNELWLRGGFNAQFTLVADGTDPSGIASANFPSASDLGSGWDTGSHPTPTSFDYFAPNAPPPSGFFNVTLENGTGVTGPPTSFFFGADSSPPTVGIDCQPPGCVNAQGPVLVTFSGADGDGSGIAQLRYTLDGSDPGPDHGTPVSPGDSISITSPDTTVKVWGVDNVGNAAEIASARVSGGSSQPGSITTSTPSAQQVATGTPVTDHVTVAPDGVATLPQGAVTFFICGPLESAQGCASGGSQVGDTQQLAGDGSGATSNSFTPNAEGWWCFRAEYAGDATFAPSQDGGENECFQAGSPAQTGPVFSVNTAADHADSSGCTVSDCTFREAILAANANGDAATIDFAIPTPAPTIQPETPLPAITNSVLVDATTQGGSPVAPPVVLDGSAAGGDGLLVEGNGSTVRGFVVEHFSIGIHVLNASHVTIEKNWSGLDPSGLVAAGNAGDGIRVENGDGDRVQSNVSGGNGGHGIQLLNATNSLVELNKTGTNAPGAAARPNGIDGIAVDGGGGNRIDGNLASGNHNQGISLFGVFFPLTSGNIVQDNRVGLAADSLAPIPNGGDGIRMFNGADNVIGGTGDGQPNTVAGNLGAGVAVYNAASTGNTIRGNAIFGNHGLGIDLGGDGVTANDTGDGDSGSNDSQNFPVLAPPLITGTTVNVRGKLVSAPNTRYAVDVYANAVCHPGVGDNAGFGEGRDWEGSQTVTTDGQGEAAISIAFDYVDVAPVGVTLTATDLGRHETSEFSQCVAPTVAGQTQSSSVTLTSNTGSSQAGAAVVSLGAIPRSAFMPPPPPAAPIESSPIESSPIESSPIESSPIESSPIESSPIESSPIESSPIESSPIESSPIESSPIESSGFTPANLRQNGLGGVPLSQLVLKAPRTWAGVLGHAVVEQSTTLADALTPPLSSGMAALQVGDIDWARSQTALASLGIGALTFGAAKLSDIRPLADWCAAIDAAQGFHCSDPTTLATNTVMDIALEGVPIESSGLGSAPIESSDLTGLPIESSPIESSMLQGTPIESSPLSGVNLAISVLGSIPLRAVLAAGSPLETIQTSALAPAKLSCGGACPATLAAAAAFISPSAQVRDLGAALNTFTIGDLKVYPGVTVGNIGAGLPANLTLRDLLKALFAHIPFDPDTLPLDGIQQFADSGGLVTYTAHFTFTGTGANAAAELHATLAPGALYVLGSAQLDGAPYGDPGVIDGDLAWQLSNQTFGSAHTLSFQVRPSLQLGTDTTQVKLLPLGAPVTSSAPLGVAVTDTFETGGGNNTPATATVIAPDKLYLSYEQMQADTDWYSLPVPAAGTITTFTLSHLGNDKDLVVFAPATTPLRSAPIESSPIESSPIESSSTGDAVPTLQQGTSSLSPVAVQDVPIESSQLATKVVAGISDNTGTSDEQVTVVASGAQQGGSYLIHVVDADPTPTSTPYVLRAAEQAPPALPLCTPRPAFPNAGQGVAGTLPAFGGVPATTKTMVLVDFKRYGDTFGSVALSNLKAELATFVARPEVAGVVLPVEGSSAVAAAYGTWDQTPCDPEKANNVVRAIISNIIDPFRSTHANVKFLVLIGGDDLLPFPRVIDNTTQANESSYRGTIGSVGGTPVNNELVGTAASGYMLTDDVWSGFNPIPFLGGQLYKPQWATGRLVETSAQIDNQLTTYNSTGGVINPTTQLSAGYGFLADSAAAVSTALNPFAPGGPGSLINDTWSHADLLARLALGSASPAVVALNMHYDHYRGLPAAQNINDLFTSTDVNPSILLTNSELGRLIFSIGCHSGYSVPDFLYPFPFSFDWPEADMSGRAIARVGNTTFGYGDTDVIAYSEQVEVDFAQRLKQSTLGEALMFAKQQYFADLGASAIGPYEQKAMNALTFYGLPMQRIGTPAAPPAPAAPTTTTDAVTGLVTVPITSNVTFGPPVAASQGFFFNGPNGVDSTNNRPYEPKAIFPDVTEPNTVPHGFLITSLGINPPLTHFLAARSRAVPDAANLTPPLSSQVGYPSALGRISSFASPNGPRQELVLVHGQFLSDTDSDTDGLGTQTNFNQIKGAILYSPAKDAIPPQLTGIRATRVGSTVGFALDTTDATDTNGTPGTVKEVLIVYYEPGASTSHTAVLSQVANTNHWSGGGPLSSAGVDSINYFAQAVDASGNVGISAHKVAAAPVSLPQQPPGDQISFSVSGAQAIGGWYSGSASVALSVPAGYVLSFGVDGGTLKPYTGAFSVSGDGLHIVDATAENAAGAILTASAAVPIDTAAPTISILSPVDGSFVLAGSAVPALYSCSDSGSGLAATNGCVGTVAVGSNIDTTAAVTPATKTFTVTAKDALGHTRSLTVSYKVWRSVGEAIAALADKTVLYLKGSLLSPILKADLTTAANALVAKNKPAACALLNLYIAAVKLAPPSVLTAAQKSDLVADATRIKVLIGCS